jgi:hypothetical protein
MSRSKTSPRPIKIAGSSAIGLPRTVDERWYVLIDLMTSDTHPNVIALGCFARHLTFYSQQVRALNLIDALCNTGRIKAGEAIAIVGAGLSGLTAAAAAARRGIAVHLFEKEGDPSTLDGRMPLQKDSMKRWVDPFIYDWPKPSPSETKDGDGPKTVRAGLPLLDWKAAEADQVRRQISSELSASFAQPTINCHHETITGNDVDMTAGDRVRIQPSKDGTRPALDVRYLILAVGFGTEDTSTSRYWTDDGYAGNEHDRKRFLVSGTGDGGLTDVMRLCISNFRHRDVISTFQVEGQSLLSEIKDSHDATDLFLKAASQVARSPGLGELTRRNVEVYLTASPKRLFNGQASVLNRLIMAWLLYENRLILIDAALRTPLPERSASKTFTVGFHEWHNPKAPVPDPGGWIVENGAFVPRPSAAPSYFDEIITRHGPGLADAVTGIRRKPLQVHFPALSATFSKNRRWWDHTPHWEDWTRFPLWDPASYEPDRAPLDHAIAQQRFSATQPACVTLGRPDTAQVVWRIAAGVVRGLYPGAQAFALDASEAFTSAAALGHALRMLCQADIAIIDITGMTPETMLMLGVRAAVRRGLSIVTQRFPPELGEPEASDATFALADTMPYLIRDVHVIGWEKEHLFRRRLRKSIEEGAARLERLGPHYSDLGVYDAVRNIGSDPQDFSEVQPKQNVLLLAPFHKKYREANAAWLRARFDAIQDDVKSTAELSYIVETPTPELTTAKLYAGLRRTAMCVADWTDQRINVFFELGIRLAINKKPVISIISSDEIVDGRPKRAELVNLFHLLQPHVYSRGSGAAEDNRFEDFLRQCRGALQRNFDRSGWPYTESGVAPDFVSRQVSTSVGAPQEYWSIPVWEELTRAADAIDGPDPHAHPVPPALFGTKAQTSAAALDRLIAAWYFLERRHQIAGHFDSTNETHKEWRAIGDKILLRAGSLGGDYGRIAAEIKAALSDTREHMTAAEISSAVAHKNTARRHREDGEFNAALGQILTATRQLEALWHRERNDGADRAQDDFSPTLRDLVQALADCYGVQGGIYRSLGQTSKSIEACDRGHYFEQHRARKKENSYNLVQRLVNRIFDDPGSYGRVEWRSHGMDMWDALRDARDVLDQQMDSGGRSDDPWAAADAILVTLLLAPKLGSGATARIADAFDVFDGLDYDSFVCRSTIRALSELEATLKSAVPVAGADVLGLLKEAVERFQEFSRLAFGRERVS